MKKTIAILLVFVSLFAYAGCGNQEAEEENPSGKVLTKEELLQDAIELDFMDFSVGVYDNTAKVKLNYCGKNVVLTGFIDDITEKEVVFFRVLDGLSSGNCAEIRVPLPMESLATFDKRQQITVVGHMTEDFSTETRPHGEYTFNVKSFSMDTAYLVQDRWTVTGKVYVQTDSYSKADWYLAEPLDKETETRTDLYFRDGVAIPKEKTSVSLSVKVGSSEYFDAILAE